MTTEDLPGGSQPRRAHAAIVPSPRDVGDDEIARVRDVSFPIAMRGYDRDAVDAYVREVNRIIAELQVGQSPRSAIRHALDQVSEETRGILERAHETADEIAARSRAQADDRLELAKREAREAIESAQKRVRTLDEDAEQVWQDRKRLIDDVTRIAAELAEVADDAAGRFPAEPETDTVALEVPEPPEAVVPEPPEPPAAVEPAVVDPEAEAEPLVPPPPPAPPSSLPEPPPPPEPAADEEERA
jgi:DivIVA domain-containing protein